MFSLMSNTTGAVVNVGLNLVLIPRAGAAGAVIATLISYGIAVLGTALCYQKTRHIGIMQLRALGLIQGRAWLKARIL